MGMIYTLAIGDYAADLNSTGVKLSIPCCESLKIVEYGFVSVATDPGTTGVLKLQYVDGSANAAVDLDSFTPAAGAAVGNVVAQRVDVLIDKLSDKYLVSVSGTPGTLTSEAQGFGAVQLNVTTGFGGSVTGTCYVKYALAGTPKTSTGTTLVTSV